MKDFKELFTQIISLLDTGKMQEACILIDDAYCLYPEYLLHDSSYAQIIIEHLHAAERVIGFDWDSYRKEIGSIK